MAIHPELYLHEQLLLLALHDEKGTPTGSTYQYAVSAAILAELLLLERVASTELKKHVGLEVRDRGRVGDPILDAALEEIAASAKTRTLEHWVGLFAGQGELRHQVARRLCKKGVLRADEEKILLLFRRKIYPELNPEPERALVHRLRNAILSDDDDLDARTVVLVSLAANAELLGSVLDEDELEANQERIERIGEGELVGEAVGSAIETMRVALVAITAATMTTTMITTNP